MSKQLGSKGFYRSRSVLALTLAGVVLSSPASAQFSLECWGYDGGGLVSITPAGSGFAQVSSGANHTVAVRTDGTLVDWGNNDNGQTTGTPTGTGFLQIASGREHTLALRTDGSIAAWGIDNQSTIDFGQVTNTPTGTGFTQVAAGRWHSVALRTDGSIVSWGDDANGLVLNTPTGLGFLTVGTGGRQSLAIDSNGSIVTWGASFGGPPTGTGFIQVASGFSHSLALRANGSIASWGSNSDGQVSDTPAGTGYVQITAGPRFSMALHSDGSLRAWGWDGTDVVSELPSGTGFTYVSAGGATAIALRTYNSDGPYCFGDGTGAACPCGVTGGEGRGCPNSSTAGSRLEGSGTASFSNDSFSLSAGGNPGDKPCLILRGFNQVGSGMGVLLGEGFLCTSGQSQRSQVQVTGANGFVVFDNFRGSPFGASTYGAGVPTNYQLWYRDSANTCSGAGFNFSNAWTVSWKP